MRLWCVLKAINAVTLYKVSHFTHVNLDMLSTDETAAVSGVAPPPFEQSDVVVIVQTMGFITQSLSCRFA